MSGSSVVIYGSSDDLIEVEGDAKGCDEYYAEEATFMLIGGDGRSTCVRIRYAEGGVWAIEVSPVEEDMPALPVSIDCYGYTARATIEGVSLVVREAL